MGKKFVASYSGGKDGVFAVYKAMQQGMIPLALITAFNMDLKRSWFHEISEPVLENVSKSLGIPVWLIKTNGDDYEKNFEKNLEDETCIREVQGDYYFRSQIESLAKSRGHM